MKPIAILVVLAVGAVFYFSNVREMLGLTGRVELPELIDVPHATFFGNERSNPFTE